MAELKLNKKIVSSLIITFVYAIVTLVCVLHHEIWSDEAQVWMLCKNLTLPELFKHLVNEGHPSLFYLLVKPFVYLTDNILSQQIICWLSCVISVFLIWNYSKFNNFTKTILTISSPFLFHFPVIARNYSLVPLLTCVLAILHSKNKEHPILYSTVIALMANTHAIMFPFASLLGIYFIYKNFDEIKNKNKIFIISATIIGFGLLALILQVGGTTQSNNSINFQQYSGLESLSRVIVLSIVNSFDDLFTKSTATTVNAYSLTMMSLMFMAQLAVALFMFLKNKKIFMLLVFSIFAQILIYTLTYSHIIFATRIYCGFMIALFCYWIFLDKKEIPKSDFKLANIFITLLFALTLINGFKNYYGDILFDYTPSKKLANYIQENINPRNSMIFSDAPGYVITLVFYLQDTHKIYNPKTSKPFTHVVWKDHTLLNEYVWTYYLTVLSKLQKDYDLYVLQSFNPFMKDKFKKFSENKFELLYTTPDSIFPSEMFRLYKFKK